MRWIQGVELTVFSLCGKSYNYILFVNSRTYKKEQFEWRFESIHNNFNQKRKKKNSNNEKERTKINNNNNSLHTDKIHKRYTSAASECITTHNRAEQQKNIEHNINNHKKLQLSQKITKKKRYTVYIFDYYNFFISFI